MRYKAICDRHRPTPTFSTSCFSYTGDHQVTVLGWVYGYVMVMTYVFPCMHQIFYFKRFFFFLNILRGNRKQSTPLPAHGWAATHSHRPRRESQQGTVGNFLDLLSHQAESLFGVPGTSGSRVAFQHQHCQLILQLSPHWPQPLGGQGKRALLCLGLANLGGDSATTR